MKIWTYILVGVFALSALFLYAIPTYIAYKNRHPRRVAIAIVNLLLGVTVFGWIAALLWATMKTPAEDK